MAPSSRPTPRRPAPTGDHGRWEIRHPARGRSRGGLTRTSIAVCDALGSRVRCARAPGPASDRTGTNALLADLDLGTRIADKALAVDRLRDDLAARRIEAVIPAKQNRRHPREHDRDMYMWRHQIETVFAKIKAFRGIATRYDKTDARFAAAIHRAAGVIAARCVSTGPK